VVDVKKEKVEVDDPGDRKSSSGDGMRRYGLRPRKKPFIEHVLNGDDGNWVPYTTELGASDDRKERMVAVFIPTNDIRENKTCYKFVHGLVGGTRLKHTCGGKRRSLYDYARHMYMKKDHVVESWILLVVHVPPGRKVPYVMASVLLIARNGYTMELDAVCGMSHTDESRRGMSLLRTKYEVYDVEEGSEYVVGRGTANSSGSLIICLALKWCQVLMLPRLQRMRQESGQAPEEMEMEVILNSVKTVPAVRLYTLSGFTPDEGGEKYLAQITANPSDLNKIVHDLISSNNGDVGGYIPMRIGEKRIREIVRRRCWSDLGLNGLSIQMPTRDQLKQTD
jgi:hypothetical protein